MNRRNSGRQTPDVESGQSNDTIDNNSPNNNGGGSSGGLSNFLNLLDNDADLKSRPRNYKRNKKPIIKSQFINKPTTRKGSDIDTTTTITSSMNNTAVISESSNHSTSRIVSYIKPIIITITSLLALCLIYDTIHSPPDKRLLGTHAIHAFLLWVKEHPGTGAAAFIFVYGLCVIFLLPGTPLTLGGGYIYKLAYGWVGGVFMATFTSMAGSLFGSCSCFILGRYIMRNQVRKWGRKYPLFDAIDIAVSDNGFKIMCLLYLTPILPLGPVSYMIGTTSMPLVKFAMAKIGALPLMLLYVLIGASTDTFFSHDDVNTKDGKDASSGVEGGGDSSSKKMGVDEETHRKMVLFGLILSIISMSLVSHFVKKELYKIFDKQKKEGGRHRDDDYTRSDSNSLTEENNIEMSGARTSELQRRPRNETL